jgi:hypothetical protein
MKCRYLTRGSVGILYDSSKAQRNHSNAQLLRLLPEACIGMILQGLALFFRQLEVMRSPPGFRVSHQSATLWKFVSCMSSNAKLYGGHNLDEQFFEMTKSMVTSELPCPFVHLGGPIVKKGIIYAKRKSSIQSLRPGEGFWLWP